MREGKRGSERGKKRKRERERLRQRGMTKREEGGSEREKRK